MEIFGVHVLGLNPAGLHKLVLTFAVLAIAFAVRAVFRLAVGFGLETTSRRSIWIRKSVRLAIGAIAGLLLLSIWFDDPGRLASFMGLMAAGLAFAAQNLVLSIAGYFVIVFGKLFDLGHRIELGGVRGDVLDIGLVKTTIMEMGVPAALFPDPHHWIAGRQYTGRVVSVVNADVFRQPVYNYTSNFNLLWEELRIPVRYGTNLAEVERILSEAARDHTREEVAIGAREFERMRRRYLIEVGDLEPQVFVQLTDNWIELSVRFLVTTHGIRAIKDRISRKILSEMARANIRVASQTIEFTGAAEIGLRRGGRHTA
jgi:small-conductance mechanosensitive channel